MNDIWAHREDLNSINNALKEKLETETDYEIEDMASAVNSIPTGSCDINEIIDGSITNLNLPNISIIKSYLFYKCKYLQSIELPDTSTIEDYAFYGCSSLTTVVLQSITSIGKYTFQGCSNLESVTLPSSTVCTLPYFSNTFMSTKIYYCTGYIYVPAELVDTYKAANNWSTYASQIRAIS